MFFDEQLQQIYDSDMSYEEVGKHLAKLCWEKYLEFAGQVDGGQEKVDWNAVKKVDNGYRLFAKRNNLKKDGYRDMIRRKMEHNGIPPKELNKYLGWTD